ncbi:molybdopterin-binding protein [Thermococcus sp. LS2]
MVFRTFFWAVNKDYNTHDHTREAAEELGLKPGDKVKAIIKATEVIIEKE